MSSPRKRSLLSMIPLSRHLPLCLKVDGKTMRSHENNFFGFLLGLLSRSKVRVLTNHFGKTENSTQNIRLGKIPHFFRQLSEVSWAIGVLIGSLSGPIFDQSAELEAIYFLEPCLERFRRPRSHTTLMKDFPTFPSATPALLETKPPPLTLRLNPFFQDFACRVMFFLKYLRIWQCQVMFFWKSVYVFLSLTPLKSQKFSGRLRRKKTQKPFKNRILRP